MNVYDPLSAAAAWEIEVERFAAGEMVPADEQAMLARCEAEPERWRAVALACAEHRRLAAALQSGPRKSSTPVGVASPETARRGPLSRAPARLAASAAAVAAFLVASGLGGYAIGLDRGRVSGGEEALRRRDEAAAVIAQLVAVTTPLVTEEMRQVLLDAGIEVREEPVIRVVEGPDGERRAVPEKQLELLVRNGHTTP